MAGRSRRPCQSIRSIQSISCIGVYRNGPMTASVRQPMPPRQPLPHDRAAALAGAAAGACLGLRRAFPCHCRGFGLPAPRLAPRAEARLAQYAAYTRAAAEAALSEATAGGDTSARLPRDPLPGGGCAGCCACARRPRRWKRRGRSTAASASTYAATGPATSSWLPATSPRSISAAVCRFIGALDSGLIAGLHGGGAVSSTGASPRGRRVPRPLPRERNDA